MASHPELGDVSRGRLLTIKNYYEMMVGFITPVQMEGLRLLLTPFPQEEFNRGIAGGRDSDRVVWRFARRECV